jgi:hypothetical protein
VNGHGHRSGDRAPVYAISYEPMPLTRLALAAALLLLRVDIMLALPGDQRQKWLLRLADRLRRRLDILP